MRSNMISSKSKIVLSAFTAIALSAAIASEAQAANPVIFHDGAKVCRKVRYVKAARPVERAKTLKLQETLYVSPAKRCPRGYRDVAIIATPEMVQTITQNFISQNPSSVQGPAGPQGPQGLQGIQGERGLTGLTGAQGPIGLAGAPGAPGAPGAAGAVGPQGPIGLTGAAGAVGPQGPQGPIGVAGVAGPQGPAGAQGAVGPQGPAGPSLVTTWGRDYFDWWDADLATNPYTGFSPSLATRCNNTYPVGSTVPTASDSVNLGNLSNQVNGTRLVPGGLYNITVYGAIPGNLDTESPYDSWVAIRSYQGLVGGNPAYLWKRGGSRGNNYPDGAASFASTLFVTADLNGDIFIRMPCNGSTFHGLSYHRIR